MCSPVVATTTQQSRVANASVARMCSACPEPLWSAGRRGEGEGSVCGPPAEASTSGSGYSDLGRDGTVTTRIPAAAAACTAATGRTDFASLQVLIVMAKPRRTSYTHASCAQQAIVCLVHRHLSS